MPIFQLLLLSLLLLFCYSLLPITSSANSITLRLSPPSRTITTKPWENLKQQAAASLERARHLKYPNSIIEQLYPRNGFYSVTLSFGTPPQDLQFVMDTGSSLTWFPCTQKYTCTHCQNSSSHNPNFIPKSSSSYKSVACASPQCKWLFPDPQCNKTHISCGYILKYGLGNTTGLLVSETLTFLPGLSVDNFIVGCSSSSDYMPEGIGIMGFGRAWVSLPAQMGLKSFSYCMVSHDLDDNTTASGDLVLTTNGPAAGSKGGKVQYTPFANNPNVSDHQNFLEYYYVGLQKITVGKVDVKVPYKYLVPDANGHGGTIVDSGTTVTYMEKLVFDLVLNEFQNQTRNVYKRDRRTENETSLGLCYNVGKNKIKKLPQLTFHFLGSVKMVLPLPNYFTYVDEQNSVLCMTIVNSGGEYGKVGPGPAIILGNYQQQEYYMEYDLENNRLGIRQQKCK